MGKSSHTQWREKMQTMDVRQKVFNYAAMRLAMNLRKNLKYFPPELQTDFLTMSDFVEEFKDENGNEDKTESIDTERDLAN